MKRSFLTTILVIVVSFVLVDMAFGLFMDKALTRTKGGVTGNLVYINTQLDDSVVVFGSSRANHHYVPGVLQDSLGVTVYNCGIDGNGILMAYCLLNNMIESGSHPKLVIYDFFPRFDLYENGDHLSPLSKIKPFFRIKGMKDIINDLAPDEYHKLWLSTYRYNSQFIQIISDALSPKQKAIKGYMPLDGTITTDFVNDEEYDESVKIDTLKAVYLKKFINLCERESIDLVFVTSPHYFHTYDVKLYSELLEDYAGSEFRLIDFRNHSKFTGHKELFQDPSHMNRRGAGEFSRLLIDSLRKQPSIGIGRLFAPESASEQN